MDKIKKALILAINNLLKSDSMLELSSYENKNKEQAFSIFGFDIASQAQLSQDAKDVLANARKAGLRASFTPLNAITGKTGSIYVGPKSSEQSTSAEDAVNNML